MLIRIGLVGMVFAMLVADISTAAMVFQSAEFGQTGLTRDQLDSQDISASNVASFNYVGVRFEIGSTTAITQIGGHFIGGFSEDTFFGAIIALADGSDFPNSDDLSTPDVIGVTSMNFPHPSAEVYGGLQRTLDPGWYAVVFGTQRFGATGRGSAMRNGTDIGSPSYIAWQPENGWFEQSDFFADYGFVVEGRVIPEPSTVSLAFLSVAFLSWYVHPRRRTRA